MSIRSFLAVLSLLAVLALAACRDSGASAGAGPDPAKVGLLVTGSTADGGWNQLAADSLNKLAKAQNLQVTVLQQVPPEKAADAIRQLDGKGYGLVIAHGFEYQAVAKELTDTPGALRTRLVVSGGDSAGSGFAALAYDLTGASYQLGIVAARVSKSGKLGFVAGEKIPPVLAMQRGFEAGAKSVNPNVTLAVQYTGWDDPAKAKKQVEAFLTNGVDVVMQDVDAASSGVFEAVKEHNATALAAVDSAAPRFVYTFGANSDQNANPICPDYTLASAVIQLDVAFAKALADVKAGTFKGGVVREDLASGVSVAVLNPKLVGKVLDADTQKLVEDAGKKLAAGELKIPDQ